MSVTQKKKTQTEKELEAIVKELRGNSGAQTENRALTDLEKIALMASAVPEAEYPTEAPKAGYMWQRYYDVTGGAIAWELVLDPDYKEPEGTFTNPIAYADGMTVEAGLFYTDGAAIWECIKSGVPSGFYDEEFFDIIE